MEIRYVYLPCRVYTYMTHMTYMQVYTVHVCHNDVLQVSTRRGRERFSKSGTAQDCFCAFMGFVCLAGSDMSQCNFAGHNGGGRAPPPFRPQPMPFLVVKRISEYLGKPQHRYGMNIDVGYYQLYFLRKTTQVAAFLEHCRNLPRPLPTRAPARSLAAPPAAPAPVPGAHAQPSPATPVPAVSVLSDLLQPAIAEEHIDIDMLLLPILPEDVALFADFWCLGGRAERHKASTLPPGLELSDQGPYTLRAQPWPKKRKVQEQEALARKLGTIIHDALEAQIKLTPITNSA